MTYVDPLVDLAKAVLATVESASFDTAVTWARAYKIAPLSREDLDGVVIGRIVVGESVDTLVGRGEGDERLNVALGLQTLIDPTDEINAADALVALTGQAKDHLKNRRLSTATYVYSFDRVVRSPNFDPEHLLENNVFSSLIVATYRLGRAA